MAHLKFSVSDDLGRYTGDALVAIDLSGRILRLNPVAEELLGFGETEAVGKCCRDVMRSSICAESCPLPMVASGSAPVTSFNACVQVAGQEALPVCIVSSALRDSRGEIVGMVESIRDIRHVRRLLDEREAALLHMEEVASWLSAIVDTVNDALIATDADLSITSFNRAAEMLTGYAKQEVLGRSCKEVFSNGFCPLEETLKGRCGLPGLEIELRGKGGRAIAVWLRTELLRNSRNEVVGAIQVLRERSEMVPSMGGGRSKYAPLVGDSPAMQVVCRWIDRLAPTDSTVLLSGESGTGKELVAEILHFHSKRRNSPLIRVNCAALPETLLESELFGHVRGAFTGAFADRPGRFELAHKGTLFLDEVGDLPLPLQAKLLRVLQDRCVERLGSGRPVPVDFRIIAATNRDLPRMIAEGRFREDLYYRLAVVPVTLPPLREHREDIPELAAGILHKLAARNGAAPVGISRAALRALCAFSWPGNVRELENALEFAWICSNGSGIELADLPPHLLAQTGGIAREKPAGTDRELIAAALGSSSTVSAAARQLGMGRATLFRKMRKLGLSAGHSSLIRQP